MNNYRCRKIKAVYKFRPMTGNACHRSESVTPDISPTASPVAFGSIAVVCGVVVVAVIIRTVGFALGGCSDY